MCIDIVWAHFYTPIACNYAYFMSWTTKTLSRQHLQFVCAGFSIIDHTGCHVQWVVQFYAQAGIAPCNIDLAQNKN